MKNTLMALGLMLSMNSAISQNNKVVTEKPINSTEITKHTGVICSNESRTKWFTLTPNYRIDGNKLFCDGFIVIKSSIGTLNKEAVLAITFKDGSRIKLKSNDLLKDNNILYFPLSELNFIILKSKEIKWVRYINKKDNVSFQYAMKPNEENYYVNLFNNYSIQRN